MYEIPGPNSTGVVLAVSKVVVWPAKDCCLDKGNRIWYYGTFCYIKILTEKTIRGTESGVDDVLSWWRCRFLNRIGPNNLSYYCKNIVLEVLFNKFSCKCGCDKIYNIMLFYIWSSYIARRFDKVEYNAIRKKFTKLVIEAESQSVFVYLPFVYPESLIFFWGLISMLFVTKQWCRDLAEKPVGGSG